jgi:hypothetical protein
MLVLRAICSQQILSSVNAVLTLFHCSRCWYPDLRTFVEFANASKWLLSRQCIERRAISSETTGRTRQRSPSRSFLDRFGMYTKLQVVLFIYLEFVPEVFKPCAVAIIFDNWIECFTVPQSSIRLKYDAILLKQSQLYSSVQKGIDLNLVDKRKLCDPRIL